MSIFNVISLLGGLSLFLYGMRVMGDGLKKNSSSTLKKVLARVTNNAVKGFLLGVLVTALIQSSKATIVLTAGLVGAGMLTLRQSIGIVLGANVGTTATGQIIRLLDLNASGGAQWLNFLKPDTLAPIAALIGIVLGNLLSMLFAVWIDFTFQFSTGAILLAFLFSASVGIIFGWAPARKASRLNPIDALRSM